MNIESRSLGRATVLQLSGILDAEAAAGFVDCCEGILPPDVKQVVLELTGLEGLDNAGAHALLALRKSLNDRAAQLRVVCSPGHIRQIYDQSGVGRQIPASENVDLAVSGFASPFRLSNEANGRVRVVFCTGRLDVKNVPEFENILKTELDAGRRAVVLALGEVTYMSSAGLCSVLKYAKLLQQSRGKLAVHAPRGPVREIIDMAGLPEIIPVLDSIDEAIWAAQ